MAFDQRGGSVSIACRTHWKRWLPLGIVATLSVPMLWFASVVTGSVILSTCEAAMVGRAQGGILLCNLFLEEKDGYAREVNFWLGFEYIDNEDTNSSRISIKKYCLPVSQRCFHVIISSDGDKVQGTVPTYE
ncbi:MAG: hypothetical protein ACFBWO_04565 [Paracoccaceae bacterium]